MAVITNAVSDAVSDTRLLFRRLDEQIVNPLLNDEPIDSILAKIRPLSLMETDDATIRNPASRHTIISLYEWGRGTGRVGHNANLDERMYDYEEVETPSMAMVVPSTVDVPAPRTSAQGPSQEVIDLTGEMGGGDDQDDDSEDQV